MNNTNLGTLMKCTYKNFIAIALLSISSVVSATMITEGYSFSVAQNNQGYYFQGNVNETQTSISSLNIAQFDASQGSLTAVDVSFTSSFRQYMRASARDTRYDRRTTRSCGWSSCSYNYWYDDTGIVVANLTQEYDIALEGIGSLSMNESDTLSCQRNSSTTSWCYDYDETTSWETIDFTATFSIDSADFASFAGTGSLGMDFTNTNTTDANCTGSAEVYCSTSNYTSNWFGTVSVNYTYDETVVSSPSIFGLTLIGFGIVLMRRKYA